MATGVARDMKRIFGDPLDLAIHINDSDEAANYHQYFHEREWVALETAVSRKRMEALLREVLGE